MNAEVKRQSHKSFKSMILKYRPKSILASNYRTLQNRKLATQFVKIHEPSNKAATIEQYRYKMVL